MLGVSGVSSDFRDLTAAKAAGNKRAALALDMFNYACKKYVGAYAAAMNGVDCLVLRRESVKIHRALERESAKTCSISAWR